MTEFLSHSAPISVKKNVRHVCDMARDDPQFRIRLPANLKSWVEQHAAANNRSLNAEIVHILTMERWRSYGDAGPAEEAPPGVPPHFREMFEKLDRLASEVEELIRERQLRRGEDADPPDPEGA